MHHKVNINILGAGGVSIATLSVDSEKLPALEERLSQFMEQNPGRAQEAIALTLAASSAADLRELLRKLDAETGLHIEVKEKEEEENNTLTYTEKKVLVFLRQGLPYKLIGAVLNISAGTVNTHILHIYRKLHVHSRHEAVERVRKLRTD